MNNLLKFGDFVALKRQENKLSQRQVVAQIGITPVYLSEMENGKKTNPSHEIMQKLITVLCLNEKEIEIFYDLHAKANGVVSQDLPEYIMHNEIVRVALRAAKSKPATYEDWQEFVDRLK